jgi:predicted MFS family arabinose efflux permease
VVSDAKHGGYLAVLRVPGAARFSAAGVLARFELAMGSLGIVLLVTGTGGSFIAATLVTGGHAAAGALFGPLISRRIDRRGQRRILLGQVAVYVPSVLLLVGCVLWGAPVWATALVALVEGTAHPNVSSLVRARWSALLRGRPQLRIAFAWESMLDAAVIALGAPLATVLCTALFPAAALLTAMLALVVSGLLLAALRDTEPQPARTDERGRGVRTVPAGILTVAVIGFFGAVLGAFDIAAVARADQLGQRTLAGWTLAAYAIGSTCGGTVFGRIGRDHAPATLYVAVLSLLVAGSVPILLMRRPVDIVICAFASGVFIAPTVIAGMTLTEATAPLGRITESLAWISTGRVVDLAGGWAGFAVVLASAACACAIAWTTVARRRWRTAVYALAEPIIPARPPVKCGDLL